jgi:peptidoglycan/LPS O-acetylase OafA/YrhL
MTSNKTDASTQMPRLAYLDALRGFAALYVVVHHVGLMSKPPLVVPDWLKPLIGFGGSGVTLFFIISGFSMCLSWNRYATAESPVKNFYTSRLRRIAPLFYLWLVLAIVRDAIFKGSTVQYHGIEIGANALFLFNLYEPFQAGLVWASWTIAVEMLFYALFPFIKRAGFDNLLKTSSLLALALAFVTLNRHSISIDQTLLWALFDGVGFFFVLPVFLIGIVTFHVYELFQSESASSLWLWIRKLMLPTALGALSLLAMYNPTGVIWYYASAVSYAMLLLGFSGWGSNILVRSYTCYLGRISYSLYLNHPTLVYILIPVYVAIYSLGLGSVVAFCICTTLTICILVPISHFTFRFIEAPGMAWNKKRNRNNLVSA